MRQRQPWSSFVRGSVVALAALWLAACGAVPDTGTEVAPPVPLTPTAGEIPEETFRATATIADGALDPDRFAGLIGTAFELAIAGDGAEHTLVIDELVDDTTIGPTGETVIGFTIEGEPGELQITLDGKPAGTFERQSASGASDG